MAWVDKTKQKDYFDKRYRANVEFARAYKLERGCADCGYDAHHAGLQFDHIQPRLRGTVASQLGKGRNAVMQEIERCEVVCATCHAIRTFERNEYNPRRVRIAA